MHESLNDIGGGTLQSLTEVTEMTSLKTGSLSPDIAKLDPRLPSLSAVTPQNIVSTTTVTPPQNIEKKQSAKLPRRISRSSSRKAQTPKNSRKRWQWEELRTDYQEEGTDVVVIPKKLVHYQARANQDLIRMLMFAVCLVVFVHLGVVLRGDISADAYFQTSVSRILLETPFWDSTGADITFKDINSVRNIYSFLQTVLIPYVYIDREFLYGSDFSFDAYNTTMDRTNGPHLYVLGGVRLRQVRYQFVECMTDMAQYNFKYCLDRDPYDQPLTVTVLNKTTVIQFETAEELNEPKNFPGKTKMFSNQGHKYDLPPPAETPDLVEQRLAEAHQAVEDLFESGFVTELTRGLFVDFNMFNPSTGLHTLCRFIFEIHASGSITTMYAFNTWNLLLYVSGNKSTAISLTFFIFLLLMLLVDHAFALYLFCRDGNYPTCCNYIVGPPESEQVWALPPTSIENKLKKRDKNNYIHFTRIVSEADIDEVREKAEDWIDDHLKDVAEEYTQLRSQLIPPYVKQAEAKNWCCGVDVPDALPCGLCQFSWCPGMCCQRGVHVDITTHIYENVAFKKQLEARIQTIPGFERAKIRGTDEVDGCGFCLFICGNGGRIFYNTFFWNKMDLFVIISLLMQCFLHIYFRMSRPDDMKEHLLERGTFHSLWLYSNYLDVENNMFVVNGFLIPLKILQYCTDLTEEFRWFRIFLATAQRKIVTFFSLLLVFLLAFAISGWLASSSDLFDFRNIKAAMLTTIRYVFIGPEWPERSGVAFFIIWYVVMSLLLIPLLIAIFVNIALSVDREAKAERGKRNIKNESHLRIIFSEPKSADAVKNLFISAFPKEGRKVERVFLDVCGENATHVDLTRAEEILKLMQSSESSEKLDPDHDADWSTVSEQLVKLEEMMTSQMSHISLSTRFNSLRSSHTRSDRH